MSSVYPVLHALLRDDVRWDATSSGLTCAPDGSLALTRVPAAPAAAPIRLDPPFDVEASGIDVDCDGHIYTSDTGANRLIVDVPGCQWRYALPPQAGSAGQHGLFHSPAGLAIAHGLLYVADSANKRVLGFVLPGLELARLVDAGLSRPTGVAVDRDRHLYVVDRGLKRVLRFNADGTPDTTYNAAMAAHAELTAPVFIALGADDTLCVSDALAEVVFAFDGDGQLLGSLGDAASVAGTRPRTLCAFRDHVFAADIATGAILVFERAERSFLGTVPGFRGPVTAMACDTAGNLFVKTDASDRYVRLPADGGCIARGTLEAGPLDAGADNDWERIAVDVDAPSQTNVTLATCVRATVAPPPTAADWTTVPGTDALLARKSGPPNSVAATQRYLWVRVTVESTDGRHSPMLRQVHAQTIGTSYLEQLPRIYRRDDEPTRFLERFLALGRGVLEDWDAELDEVYRRFDPATAPADTLAWLAASLAMPLPPGLAPDAQRALLARVPDLYARRGTIAGIADVAEIVSGMRPHIFEAYRARRVWQLETASLGFDTALAASAPDGFIVPGQTPTDPAYIGLRGDFYAGVNFERHVDTQTDRTIDFDARNPVTPREDGKSLDRFSVRWSGQVKPAFSETYTFHTTPSDGVQLWVDGRPLIDSWTGQTEPGPALITLDANRWYPITFEMHRVGNDPVARLEWTSRSQRQEVVPASALYSLLDDQADLSDTTASVVDVGNAVVGATGPLAAGDFGATLFSDYAHLFTVVVSGARCCEAQQRRALRSAIDAEKPAHTDYHLCFAEARMRVGYQARLGIDAIVAEGPLPMRLDGTTLGRDSYLAGESPALARVGATARVGQNTVIS
jgi:phage tail-like protein